MRKGCGWDKWLAPGQPDGTPGVCNACGLNMTYGGVKRCLDRRGGVVTDTENKGNIPLIGKPIDRSRLTEHILYHVMPLAGDTEWVWRRHCDWLREVRGNFNGRLIVGIVTHGAGDTFNYLPPEAVYEALKDLDAEFITAPNDVSTKKGDKGLGEGVLFPRMLGKLQTEDPDQIAYYGHCKGVTRTGQPLDGAIHRWAEAMFETLFRNQGSVVSALDSAGVCGPFRMRGGFADGQPGLGSAWFFSGTFFATRLVDAFARNWSYMRKHYGCVEQWPRTNFDQFTQAKCLFFDAVHNLYNEDYWRDTVWPRVAKWRADRAAGLAPPWEETVTTPPVVEQAIKEINFLWGQLLGCPVGLAEGLVL